MRFLRKLMHMFSSSSRGHRGTATSTTHSGTSGGIIGAIKGFFRGRSGRRV